MERTCRQCDAPLPIHKGRHRPRVFCETCRPSKPVSGVSELRPGVSPEVPSLTEATERRLREADRLYDPAAIVVLQLARSIDAGGHSGASLASLSREFRAALDAALAGSVTAAADEDGVHWGVG